MKDLIETLQKLRADAEYCDLASARAADPAMQAMFAKLASRLRQSVAEVEQVIAGITPAGEA